MTPGGAPSLQVPDALRCAYLSDAVKERIFQAYTSDPVANSYQLLAQQYRVRPERIAAIVALKELEHKCRWGLQDALSAAGSAPARVS